MQHGPNESCEINVHEIILVKRTQKTIRGRNKES